MNGKSNVDDWRKVTRTSHAAPWRFVEVSSLAQNPFSGSRIPGSSLPRLYHSHFPVNHFSAAHASNGPRGEGLKMAGGMATPMNPPTARMFRSRCLHQRRAFKCHHEKVRGSGRSSFWAHSAVKIKATHKQHDANRKPGDTLPDRIRRRLQPQCFGFIVLWIVDRRPHITPCQQVINGTH